MTERLYFSDSHLLEFDARVVGRAEHEGRPAVVLDRTAFYPTGGGQPNDAGSLAGFRVVDVVETEDGRILHVLGGEFDSPSDEVTGRIDAARRRDHMQQHTGQHVLSQAFVQLFGAETRAFRMGAETSEIDVDLADATPEQIARAEQLANDVVFDDRPTRVHAVDREAAARLPLRKQSEREGELRVIEIEGYDWSPCGGTHARRTGEVGIILVRSVERAKGLLRVEFVCGNRALADYRRANASALETALVFSTARDDAPGHARRLVDEAKALRRRVRELAEVASEVEGKMLYDSGEARDGYRLVARRLDGRSPDELRSLAQKATQEGPAVVLLAGAEGGAARLVFARSEELALDCGALLRAACERLGGRGGGKPALAQGGGPNVDSIDATLASAAADAVAAAG